jgi:hypothetical protein
MTDRRRIKPWIFRRILGLLLLGAGLGLALSLISAPVPVHATPGAPTAPSLRLWDGTPSRCLWDGAVTTRAEFGDDAWTIHASSVLTIYLPLIAKPETCQPIPGESYGTVSADPPPTNRPAEEHPDLNLALRDYELTGAFKGLVVYSGGGEPEAPQLPGLFSDDRTGVFNNVYQVYDWDWLCDCRGDLLTEWPVTLAGLEVSPGETIHVPDSGHTIGSGYEVLVLYASIERITLKYTRADSVRYGYTLHVENVCVEPSLLALYQASNDAGRGQLPALRSGQAFGRARGAEIGVAIRDTGSFMDPRSRNDWWRGR